MKNIKQLLYIIPLFIVAAGGIYINTKYYWYYFIDSSYPEGLSIIMAIFFILFESILWLYNTKNLAALKISLVVFSVFVTFSSQFLSTSVQESETAHTVYQAVDTSGDIDRYQKEIENINAEIAKINKARTEDFMFTRTDSDLDYYRSEKSKYEALLSDAKAKNEISIQEVVEVKTIYKWFAEDLPNIFKNGLDETLIRVLFQLFSSVILALAGPVCLSQIRKYREFQPKQTKTRKRKSEPKKVTKQTVKQKKDPFGNLTTKGVENIIKMLTSHPAYPETMYQPSEAHNGFKKVWSEQEAKIYTEEECRLVYNWIYDKGLMGKEVEVIQEEARNART